mmetsp:Transcript_10540/g.48457  ORF Transcript_10540/g.48457 Transcript_10540/m.48457 type:complete len:260 (+) Transcript_10540:1204-1983(+)
MFSLAAVRVHILSKRPHVVLTPCLETFEIVPQLGHVTEHVEQLTAVRARLIRHGTLENVNLARENLASLRVLFLGRLHVPTDRFLLPHQRLHRILPFLFQLRRDVFPVRVDFPSERLAPASRVQQTPSQQLQVLPGGPVRVRGHLPALHTGGTPQRLERAILPNLSARRLEVPRHSRPRENHPASLRAQRLRGGASRELVRLKRPRGHQLVTLAALGGAGELAVFHPVSLQVGSTNYGGALLGQRRVFPDGVHRRTRDG